MLDSDTTDLLSILDLEDTIRPAFKAAQGRTGQMLRKVRDVLYECTSMLIETSVKLNRSKISANELRHNHSILARCLTVLGPSARTLLEASDDINYQSILRTTTKQADAITLKRKGLVDDYLYLAVRSAIMHY